MTKGDELPEAINILKGDAFIEKLERPIVVELIEKISIYSKDRIAIHFFHEDEMKEMIELSGVLEEDSRSEGGL